MTQNLPESYRTWLEQHLAEATAAYERAQAAEEGGESEDEDAYEHVHQMWGYLAGLEKALKQYIALGEKRG